MNIKKLLKNKRGSGIMDFFIIMIVTLLVGSAIFFLGSTVKKGVGDSGGKAKTMNSTLNNNTKGLTDDGMFGDPTK